MRSPGSPSAEMNKKRKNVDAAVVAIGIMLSVEADRQVVVGCSEKQICTQNHVKHVPTPYRRL